ncbi:MAG: hypothetical protein O3B76_10395 [Proteobacteria bacterium]|nr:hypothetical protein [Pseudomonadota bacterium]
MTGVFANIKDEHIRQEPFPHACIRGALEQSYYDDLADGYPEPSVIC